MKFSAKLTLLIVVILFIVGPILGFTVFYSARNILQESIGQNQMDFARQTIDNIDRVLYGAYQGIQIIGEKLVFKDYVIFPEEKEFGKTYNELDKLSYLTGPWDEIEIFSKQGTLVLSTNKDNIGRQINEQDEAKRFLFDYVIKNEKTYYSDLVFSKDTGKPTIIFATPIKDEEFSGHPIIGVAVGSFAWTVISEMFDKAEIGYIHLFNKDGITIAAPTINKQEILKQDLKHIDTVKQALKGDCGSSSSSSSSSFKLAEGENILVLNSCALQNGYLGYKGSGWGLLLETPQSLVFAPVNKMARNFALIFIFVLGSAITVFYFIGKQLTKPVELLTSAAQVISAGDLTKRVEVTSKDEIGRLGESFNQMVDNLLGAEKYNRNLIEASLDPLVTISKEGKITDVNEATVKATGFSREKLIGTDFSNYFTNPDKAREGYKEVLSKGSVKNYPLIIRHKNGGLMFVSYNASVYRDNKGEIKGVFAAARDVAEVKKYAANRLSEITPVLQKISMGDFSQNIKIPKEEDEFTEHLVALNLMIDDLRETVGKNAELVKALEKEKASLEQKVKERTVSVDAANQQLKAGNQQLEAANQQLAASQKNLQDKLLELERFNKVAVGRELKMVELKEEIKRLKSKEQ